MLEDEISEQALFDEPDPVALVPDCDFAHFLWAPTRNRLKRICGKETSIPADPTANNVFLEYDGITSLDRGPIGITALEKSACIGPLRCITQFRSAVSNMNTNFFVNRNHLGERDPIKNFVGEHAKVISSN